MQANVRTATGAITPALDSELYGAAFAAATDAVVTIRNDGAAGDVLIYLEVLANTTDQVMLPYPIRCPGIYFTLVSGTGTMVTYHE